MDYNGMIIKPIFKPIVNNKPTSSIPIDEWDHIIEWNKSTSKGISPENLDIYISDTYELIKYYGSTDCMDGNSDLMLQKLADYGEKYGIPFGNGKTNEVKIFEIQQCLANLDIIVQLFMIDESLQLKIDVICKIIANAIKHEQAKGVKGDYVFIPIYPVTKEFAKEVNSYIIPTADNEYLSIAYNCSDNEHYKNVTYPLIKIKCNINDLYTIENGSYADKVKFLKGRITEGFSELLNANKPEFNMTIDEKGSPIIELLTDNHLIYFLITILTNSKYNFCANPKCNKLLANGNKYCSGKKCMETTVKGTPKAKLKRMISNWNKRDKVISFSQKLKLEEQGIKLLEYMEYEEVVKEIQILKRKILDNKKQVSSK